MSIASLLQGYNLFYQRYFSSEDMTYKGLSTIGQQPDCMIISCSDSRVDPSILFNAAPGELFVVRNVANLIPPYQPEKKSLHGVSAALEFGIQYLNIRHLIVLGHSQCAGIKALYEGLGGTSDFIEDWVESARSARETVKEHHHHEPQETQLHLCEKEAIKLSVQHLHEFPWIQDKIAAGVLDIHGWYFQVHDGKLFFYNEGTGDFLPSL